MKLPVISFSTRRLCCSCVLENAILAFGNGSDVKTGGSQPGMPSPAMDNQSPHLATTTPGVLMETEQNTLRAQIPAQVRQDGSFVQSKQRGANGNGLAQNWVALFCRWLGVFVLSCREQRTGGIYIICIIQTASRTKLRNPDGDN